MPEDAQFYVGQKAIINKIGEVLVLNDPIIGADFPGGKVQVGETNFAKALEREVYEETTLKIKVGDPFAQDYFEVPKDIGHRNGGKKIYLVIFACTYVSGEITLSSEHDKSFWVNKNNYKQLVTKSWSQHILEKYFSL